MAGLNYLPPHPNRTFGDHGERIARLERRIDQAKTVAPARRGTGPLATVAAADTPETLALHATYRCDGVADQAEINEALSAHSHVLLLPGGFATSGGINIPDHGTLEGSGPATIITCTVAAYAVAAVTGDDDILVATLSVVAAGGSGAVFLPSGSDGCAVFNCYFEGQPASQPLVVFGSGGGRFIGNFTTNVGDVLAVHCLNGTRQVITDNHLYGGIALESTDQSVVTGNHVGDSPSGGAVEYRNGISIIGHNGNVVVGNVVAAAYRHGIYLFQAMNNTVVGNTVLGASAETSGTYDGIHLDNECDANAVQANMVRGGNSLAYGIRINSADCDNNLVANNDLLGAGATGEFHDGGTGTRGTGGLPTGGGGVTDHDALTGVSADDHHTENHAARHGSAGADPVSPAAIGAAATGHAHTLVDADIPASIARDAEVTAAVTAHEAAADPHATYLTGAEGDSAYSPVGHTHDGGGGTGQAATPYYVPVGETFTVPEYAQVLFSVPMVVDGALDIEGILVEITEAPDLSIDLAMVP